MGNKDTHHNFGGMIFLELPDRIQGEYFANEHPLNVTLILPTKLRSGDLTIALMADRRKNSLFDALR